MWQWEEVFTWKKKKKKILVMLRIERLSVMLTAHLQQNKKKRITSLVAVKVQV